MGRFFRFKRPHPPAEDTPVRIAPTEYHVDTYAEELYEARRRRGSIAPSYLSWAQLPESAKDYYREKVWPLPLPKPRPTGHDLRNEILQEAMKMYAFEYPDTLFLVPWSSLHPSNQRKYYQRAKAARNNTMPMSTDFVRFSLSRQNLQRAACSAYGSDRGTAELLVSTLGLTLQEATRIVSSDMPTIIECRPSQFARFVITRNEAGYKNDFKGLDPKLVEREPEQPYTVINTIKRDRVR